MYGCRKIGYIRRRIAIGIEVGRPIERRLHAIEVAYISQAAVHC